MRRARLEDVAKLAGVSMATVSRALSSPAVVREKTLERVQSAIAALGYVPDASARTLASGRSRTVGAVVPTLDNAIFSNAIQGLQTTLAEHGYQLLLATHNYNLKSEIAVVRALSERAVDALVLVGSEHAHETFSILEKSGIHALLTWSLSNDYPCIGFDNFEIGAMAARHLLELGHRRFGMISGITRHNDRARQRVEGFVNTLKAHGLAPQPGAICEQPYGFAGGRAGLQRLMSVGAERPTAIFCGNDVLALGCLFEAASLGIRVPDDLSVIGCDDLPIAAEIAPGLTTISLHTRQLGELAAHALLDWSQDGTIPGRTELPVSLARRGTTGPAPQ